MNHQNNGRTVLSSAATSLSSGFLMCLLQFLWELLQQMWFPQAFAGFNTNGKFIVSICIVIVFFVVLLLSSNEKQVSTLQIVFIIIDVLLLLVNIIILVKYMSIKQIQTALFINEIGEFVHHRLLFTALLTSFGAILCLICSAALKPKPSALGSWLLVVSVLVIFLSNIVIFLLSFKQENQLTVEPYSGNISFDSKIEEIEKQEIKTEASSFFTQSKDNGTTIQYSPDCVLNNGEYPWIERDKEDGLGEWIQLDFSGDEVIDVIGIHPGFGDSEGRFFKEKNCPRNVKLSFSDGSEVEYELKKENELQFIQLSHPVKTRYLKITILTVYHGTAKTHETCIARVKVYRNINDLSDSFIG